MWYTPSSVVFIEVATVIKTRESTFLSSKEVAERTPALVEDRLKWAETDQVESVRVRKVRIRCTLVETFGNGRGVCREPRVRLRIGGACCWAHIVVEGVV